MRNLDRNGNVKGDNAPASPHNVSTHKFGEAIAADDDWTGHMCTRCGCVVRISKGKGDQVG